jgi:small GTP-binding protein
MDRIDHASSGQARSLFEGAVRAERLLLSASLDAEAGDVAGTLRHLEELRDLVDAGTAVRGQYRMKICFLGEGAVGKSSLIRRFVHGSFGEEYQQTIGTRISHREIGVPAPGGKGVASVNLSIWDIMGHERLGRLMQSYLLGAQGGLLVYSLVDRKSEEALHRWVEALDRTTGRIPLVVLANKADLMEKSWKESGGPELAKDLRAEVLPSSAKTGLNVELGFSTIVRKVLKKGGKEE